MYSVHPNSYIIVIYGQQLAYGPFKTESEARNHADAYLQDYRTLVLPCKKVPEPVDE